MKALLGLLLFFLIIGLCVRKYDAKTRLLLITFIIGVLVYITVKL